MSRLALVRGILAALALAVPSLAHTQTPPPRPACATAEHRQFDFWIGEWDVRRPDGQRAGINSITREHGGCVLHERYTSVGGYTGSSLNIYDASRKRWHQTWTDKAGLLLELNGGFRDGSMIMSGETVGADGTTTRERITWTPRPDGTVRQLWEQSADGGTTWTVAFDGIYSRR